MFVTPTFEKMFKDFGGAMPAPTQFLIDLSHFMTSYWYLIFGIPVALFVAWRAWVGTKSRQGPVGRLRPQGAGLRVR